MSHDPYVATLRAFFRADDEVEAILIADKIAENGSLDLEEDDGDTLGVTQVCKTGVGLTPQEVVEHLRITRNVLIRTRVKRCFEMAREIDQLAWALEHGDEQTWSLAGYDYSKFLDVAEAILVRKEDPQ